MIAYMPNADGVGEREPICDVAVLTDTDGDGRYDKRAVFVEKLSLPRAISLVGDGLLVGEPLKLWFYRDKDGDGLAEDGWRSRPISATSRTPSTTPTG